MSKRKQTKVAPQPPAGAPEHIVVGAVEPGGLASYAVPGEVAIALNTGRSQFINGLVSRVRKGESLPPVQVIGMLELIRDWTDARYADDKRNRIVQESLSASMTYMQDLRAHVNGLVRKIGETVTEAHRVATRHGSGPLGQEDDLE